MNVGELIKTLQTFPQDLPVCVWDEFGRSGITETAAEAIERRSGEYDSPRECRQTGDLLLVGMGG